MPGTVAEASFEIAMELMTSKLEKLIETSEEPQVDPKVETKQHVVTPAPTINPNLTANERTRIFNIGNYLFNGGMQPLTEIFGEMGEGEETTINPTQAQINEIAPTVDTTVLTAANNGDNRLGEALLAGMEKIANKPQDLSPIVPSPEINTTVNIPPIEPPVQNTTVNVPPVDVPQSQTVVQPVLSEEKPVDANITSNERSRFQKIGEALFTGGMKPLSKIRQGEKTAAKMAGPVKTKGFDFGKLIGNMLGKLAKMFNIPMLIMALIEAIPDIITGIWNTIKKWIIPVLIGLTFFVGMLQNPKFWSKLGGYLWDGIVWVLEKLWDGIVWVGKKIWDFIIDQINAVIERWIWVWEQVSGLFKWVWDKVTRFANWIRDKVTGLFKIIWDKLPALPREIIKGVINAVKTIGQKVWRFFEKIFGFIAKIVMPVMFIVKKIKSALASLPLIGRFFKGGDDTDNIDFTPPAVSDAIENTNISTDQSQALNTTEIENNVSNNINNNTNNVINNNYAAPAEKSTPVIVQAPVKAPVVNVSTAKDVVQHDLMREQTKVMKEMSDTMQKVADKPVSTGGNVTNMTVLNSASGSAQTSSITSYNGTNASYSQSLLQGARQQ